MSFAQLSDRIEWRVGTPGELHTTPTQVASSRSGEAKVVVWQPGVYAFETKQSVGEGFERRDGGDFVIEVTDLNAGWTAHKFSHGDLFTDVAAKTAADAVYMRQEFAPTLVGTVAEDADTRRIREPDAVLPGLRITTLLVASVCLAVCEFRRYPEYEPLGGRALPARFALGVIWRIWSAQDATSVEKEGRAGLRRLRDRFGMEPSFSEVLGRPLRFRHCMEQRDMNSRGIVDRLNREPI